MIEVTTFEKQGLGFKIDQGKSLCRQSAGGNPLRPVMAPSVGLNLNSLVFQTVQCDLDLTCIGFA